MHELADIVGISYGVCQEILTEDLYMRHIAPSSRQTTEFVTNNNLAIVPHPPYSPDLAPCDFALFPKLKMKLKGRRFEAVSDIQRESQAVLDSFKENDFHGAFEA
jgi:transposase